MIQEIYQIEYTISERASPACRKLIRQTRARPKLLEIYDLIPRSESPLLLPQSKLGEAITYAQNQREKIEEIFEDGRYHLDTRCEHLEQLELNAIRITKVGAKNFLFFGSAEAGNQNALLYTILENCKVHGLCPENYLCQTIETLNALGPDPSPEQIAALTPARVAARQESETQAA